MTDTEKQLLRELLNTFHGGIVFTDDMLFVIYDFLFSTHHAGHIQGVPLESVDDETKDKYAIGSLQILMLNKEEKMLCKTLDYLSDLIDEHKFKTIADIDKYYESIVEDIIKPEL